MGSGNVFADLAFPNADEMLAKAKLASEICAIMSRQNLTQVAAAQILGVDQPKVSALMRGKLSGFSTERLFRFLNALGHDVEIHIRPKASARGRALVDVVGRKAANAPARPSSRAAATRRRPSVGKARGRKKGK